MSLTGGNIPAIGVYGGSTAAVAVYLGSTKIWEKFTGLLVPFTTVGTSSYDLAALKAAGATKVDRIVLGGGQGGAGATFGAANGGNAGVFAWDQQTIGSATSISVTVGDGGAGGASGADGVAGQASSATINGNTLTGAGGPTGSAGGQTGDAVASGNANSGKDVSYNGQTYAGGATSTTTTTSVPGSGGRGGGSFAAGSNGGRGQVWLYFS